MRRTRRMMGLAALAASAASVAMLGCGSSDSGLTLPKTQSNVVGTFKLNSAGGKTLPYQALVSNGEIWNLTADRITLSGDGTWVDTIAYVVQSTSSGTTSDFGSATAGTYVIANDQINFAMKSGGTSTFTGAVVENTLTVNFNGQKYIYFR